MKLLDLPSSSYYYSLNHQKEKDEISEQKKYRGLRKKVEKIIRKHPGYGYRRIKDTLFKQGIIINHKPLKKLLIIWNLKRIRKIKTPKASPLAQHIKNLGAKVNLVAKLREIKIFQVIFTDFTEIVCQFGTIYFIPFSDKVSRRIIGWNVDLQENTDNALRGYRRARRYLKKMKVDLTNVIIHQDQDSVFTSYEYAGTLLNDGATLSFTEKGFKDNSAMESCIGHFKDEYENRIQEAKDLKEAKKIIARCVRDWNRNRIHSALKGRSPDEFIHTFNKL